MEKKNLIQELDESIGRMDDEIISKLDMNDATPITRKELREYMLVIQFCQLAIRDVIEFLHREEPKI